MNQFLVFLPKMNQFLLISVRAVNQLLLISINQFLIVLPKMTNIYIRRNPIPEKDRLYSRKTKLYIKKHSKDSEISSSGRPFDCTHACLFCKKLVTNLQAHLLYHTALPEIKAIQVLNKKAQFTFGEEKLVITKEIRHR